MNDINKTLMRLAAKQQGTILELQARCRALTDELCALGTLLNQDPDELRRHIQQRTQDELQTSLQQMETDDPELATWTDPSNP